MPSLPLYQQYELLAQEFTFVQVFCRKSRHKFALSKGSTFSWKQSPCWASYKIRCAQFLTFTLERLFIVWFLRCNHNQSCIPMQGRKEVKKWFSFCVLTYYMEYHSEVSSSHLPPPFFPLKILLCLFQSLCRQVGTEEIEIWVEGWVFFLPLGEESEELA